MTDEATHPVIGDYDHRHFRADRHSPECRRLYDRNKPSFTSMDEDIATFPAIVQEKLEADADDRPRRRA